jgi:O-antigen/teichoic acid export membrane protein
MHQLAFVIGEAVLSVISGGVIFIVISRVSGPDLLGKYALALAWLLAFQGLSGFGIPAYIMREVGAYGRNAATQVVHAMVLGLGTGLLGLGVMLGASRLVGYSMDVVDIVAVASLALIPSSFTAVCRSVFLALRMMHFTFLAVLIEVAITMSVSLYLILSGGGAMGLMIALVVAKAASAAISLALLYSRIFTERPAISGRVLAGTARTVFTFGIGSMLGMLTMRINTIMVSIFADIASVGHFAAATKIMEIGLIVPTLFVQLLMTRIAYSFNTLGVRDPNQFASWYQALFALVLPTCVGGWVFAEFILHTLFGPGFVDSVWILRILVIYLVIEAADAAMSVTLQAAQRQREDTVRLAFNPLVNFTLNLALLPVIGTIGAALGRVGGVAVSATLRSLFIARTFARVHWFRFAMKPAAISIAIGTLCHLLQDAVHPAILMLGYCAATAILLVLWSAVSPAVIRDIMRAPSARD